MENHHSPQSPEPEHTPPTTAFNSSNQKLWLGLAIGSLFTLIVMLTYEGYLPVTMPFLMGVMFTIVILLLLSIIGLHFYRDKLLKRWFGKEVDIDNVLEDLQQGVQSLSAKVVDTALVGVDKEKRSDIKWLLPRFINYILFSQLRNWGLRFSVTVLATLGGLLGTILLFHQNQLLTGQSATLREQNGLLKDQNQLLTSQNEKIDNQILLDEAARRSSLNFLMANVLDEISRELREPENKNRRLSPQLIGRIASLSQSFQPYRFMEDEKMINKPLSPERGNLLLALVNSNLDTLAMDSIYEKTLFKEAYLKGAIIDTTYLKKADLSGANLSGVNLSGANLSGANLSDTDLSQNAILKGTVLMGTVLSGADLTGADLTGANLSSAVLTKTNLSGANLAEVILRKAYVIGANLSRTNLIGTDFSGTDLSGADLSGADLSGANLTNKTILSGVNFKEAILSRANLNGTTLNGLSFSEANLSETNFSNANLNDAILIKANLNGADLSGANLTGANLSEADLSGADLSGADLSGANLSEADLSEANLSEAVGLTEETLKTCAFIYQVKGLPDNLAAKLKTKIKIKKRLNIFF